MTIEELVGDHRIVELFKEHHDNGQFARALALEGARAAFKKASEHCDHCGLDHTAKVFDEMAKELE